MVSTSDSNNFAFVEDSEKVHKSTQSADHALVQNTVEYFSAVASSAATRIASFVAVTHPVGYIVHGEVRSYKYNSMLTIKPG